MGTANHDEDVRSEYLARACTSARSTGFCADWVCICTSSSSKTNEATGRILFPLIQLKIVLVFRACCLFGL